jgi:hypothetical protein
MGIGIGIAGLLWVIRVASSLKGGLPKAPSTPEDAIRSFLGSALPRRQSLESIDYTQGYLLLLDKAKQKVESFAGFKVYWTGVRAKLLKEVGERLQVKGDSSIRCLPKELKPVEQKRSLLIYEALIQVEALP